jgi:hypothetical protein
MNRITTSLVLAATLASSAFARPAPHPHPDHARHDTTQQPHARPPLPDVADAAPTSAAEASAPAPSPPPAADARDAAPSPPAVDAPDVAEATEPDAFAAPVVRDRATVRAMLAVVRAHNLAAFHAYAAAGVYPSNIYTDGELNVWRDDDGHFCAAATMIRASGEIALTDRVAEQSSNIKLGDVTQGPLMDWMLTSGLTQDEVALIQRPFRPVAEKPDPQLVAQARVDARKRAAETARLKKLYARIERQLARQQAKSLDAATDQLMKHPALIEHLVELDARYEATDAAIHARKS